MVIRLAGKSDGQHYFGRVGSCLGEVFKLANFKDRNYIYFGETSVDVEFKEMTKKEATVSVGAHAITDKQYSLIREQFACICDFLGWEKNLIFLFPPGRMTTCKNQKK